MTKVIIDNDTPEGRQRQLEAKVQVAFAAAAATMLEFMVDKPGRGDLIAPLQAFIDTHTAARADSTDPKGIAIRTPSLEVGPVDSDPDAALNLMIRGCFRLEAARLRVAARHPAPDAPYVVELKRDPDYRAGIAELNEGITLSQRGDAQ